MNEKLSLAVFDLLFTFGSGVMRGTCASSPQPVNDDYPLCRTQQLLLCVSLVMLRQVTYSYRVEQTLPQRMAMNQFEELLIQHCKDVPRIISETVQLENYIFRQSEQKAPEKDSLLFGIAINLEDEAINDLDFKMNILPELALQVKEFRCKHFNQLFNAKPQKLIRSVKRVKEINITLFFRRFGNLYALAQLYELP